MLICVKPLVWRDSRRGEVRFKPGRRKSGDYLAESHPAALAHPECFAPAPDGRISARTAIRATMPATARPRTSAKPHGLERWRIPTPSPECSLRFERGNTRARLASEAKQDLLRVLDVTKRDGLEALAGLFGVQHRHFVDVVSVVDLGGERTPTSVNGADLTSS